MKKNIRLGDICTLRFGYYGQPDMDGSVEYLQLKQFDINFRKINNTEPERIKLDQSSQGHLLASGDVLFVGKGNRLFAWVYDESAGPAVASSVFFVLRPKKELILSEYLAAILNSAQSKTALLKVGGSTSIFSIRNSELSAFEIPLPSIQQQKTIASLTRLHQQEIQLYHQLIAEKQNLQSAVFTKLVK